MDTVEKYQQQLLEQSQYIYSRTPIRTRQHEPIWQRHGICLSSGIASGALKNGMRCTSRILAEHVATLYTNKPLILFGDNDDNIPSTISQPSFVLRMLDLLQLQPGQRSSNWVLAADGMRH